MVLREFRYEIRNITFIANHVQYSVIYSGLLYKIVNS